jgi:hypothetical protein
MQYPERSAETLMAPTLTAQLDRPLDADAELRGESRQSSPTISGITPNCGFVDVAVLPSSANGGKNPEYRGWSARGLGKTRSFCSGSRSRPLPVNVFPWPPPRSRAMVEKRFVFVQAV